MSTKTIAAYAARKAKSTCERCSRFGHECSECRAKTQTLPLDRWIRQVDLERAAREETES